MRRGRIPEAREVFRRAGLADSTSYDAAAGAGMAAYRGGDLAAARSQFERALRLTPGDSTALDYLARIPHQLVDASPRTHVRPMTTVVAARTGKRILEVRDSEGLWLPVWIKAVNLGAAVPGKFPSEFPPDDGTYDSWIKLLAEMGANAVRVYTIHPPHFYSALRKWNLAHPTHPVWLIHGVWTEPPPGKKQEKYDDPKWDGQFRAEMRRVVSRRRVPVDAWLHHWTRVGAVLCGGLQYVPEEQNRFHRKVHRAERWQCARGLARGGV
jgi:hypothetical protein